MLHQYPRTFQSYNLSYLQISYQEKIVLLRKSYKFPSSIVVWGGHQKRICRCFIALLTFIVSINRPQLSKLLLTTIHPWIPKAITTELVSLKTFNPNLQTKLIKTLAIN